jgi:hypothetical protein
MIRPHYLNHVQFIKSMTERRITVNTVMDQLTRLVKNIAQATRTPNIKNKTKKYE